MVSLSSAVTGVIMQTRNLSRSHYWPLAYQGHLILNKRQKIQTELVNFFTLVLIILNYSCYSHSTSPWAHSVQFCLFYSVKSQQKHPKALNIVKLKPYSYIENPINPP